MSILSQGTRIYITQIYITYNIHVNVCIYASNGILLTSAIQFHPELNPIERCWGKAKQYARSNCNYTTNGLRETVPIALESVTVDLIRQYFRKVRDYHTAYIEGMMTGNEADKQVKIMYHIKTLTCSQTYTFIYVYSYSLAELHIFCELQYQLLFRCQFCRSRSTRHTAKYHRIIRTYFVHY